MNLDFLFHYILFYYLSLLPLQLSGYLQKALTFLHHWNKIEYNMIYFVPI